MKTVGQVLRDWPGTGKEASPCCGHFLNMVVTSIGVDDPPEMRGKIKSWCLTSLGSAGAASRTLGGDPAPALPPSLPERSASSLHGEQEVCISQRLSFSGSRALQVTSGPGPLGVEPTPAPAGEPSTPSSLVPRAPLYVWTAFCLSTHPSVDTCVASTF